MEKRALGKQGLKVSALGLGCMGMTFAYGPADETEALRTLERSLELGIDFWDSAETYGPFTNESLLGRALRGKRQRVIVATKFGWEFGPNGERGPLNSRPDHIRRSVEGSLRRLGTDYIDLYYQHRLDPRTPIEETVGAMATLVKEGKVRFLGLSEVGAGTLRRACAVHPISALQSEYSLWETNLEADILAGLRELGVGLVAYSPVGRGFLTGKIQSPEDFEAGDFRKSLPRFQPENFSLNLRLVQAVREIAAANALTPAQVALAWLLRRGEDIVPIPGTTRVSHLEENARATEIHLSDADWAKLDRVVREIPISGARYAAEAERLIDRT